MNEAVKTTKGKFLVMAVVLATMLVALAAASKPADAYTQATGGRAGSVTTYKIEGTHLNPCAAMSYSCYAPYVRSAGPLVYRSPATTGKQLIGLQYELAKWNGSNWVVHSTKTYARYLQAGNSWIRMDGHEFQLNSPGYYRVKLSITWQTPTNQYLGHRIRLSDQPGDYYCNTQWTDRCNASNGWLELNGTL